MCVFCAKDFVAAKLQALSVAAVVVDTQIAVRVCVYVCANIFALCCRPGGVWEGGLGDGNKAAKTLRKKTTRKNYENENP